MPKSTKIKVIDLGSATFNEHHHSTIVSTRHYRAPEVILQLGWSYPCDIWSIGCILVELFTGEALFQTHHNIEHLAMMDKVLGTLPPSLLQNVKPTNPTRKFLKLPDCNELDWPAQCKSDRSRRKIHYMKSLDELLDKEKNPEFYDLIRKCLIYTPDERITAKEAMQHPFLTPLNPSKEVNNPS